MLKQSRSCLGALWRVQAQIRSSVEHPGSLRLQTFLPCFDSRQRSADNAAAASGTARVWVFDDHSIAVSARLITFLSQRHRL